MFKTYSAFFFLSVIMTAARADPCLEGSSASDCGENPPTAVNPDAGKDMWTVPSNNAGGGGLRGNKCTENFPHCKVCAPGFKSCEECDAPFEANEDGQCLLTIDFNDLILASAPIPDGYRGLTWSPSAYAMRPELMFSSDSSNGYLTASNFNSNPVVAYNTLTNSFFFRSPAGTSFDLKSMKLTSAYKEDLVVRVIGYTEDEQTGSLSKYITKTVTLTSPEESMQVEFPGFENIILVMIVALLPQRPFDSKAWRFVVDDIVLA